MNKNRRLLIKILFIILTSVFFVSCGIPTYRTLSNISITSSSTNEGYKISFTGTDSDLTYVNDGPGLLLLYVESDSNANSFSSSITSAFATEYGDSSSIGKKVVIVNSDNPVLEVNDSTKLYSFRMNNEVPSPWKYFFDISENSNSNSIYSNYSLSTEDNKIKIYDGTNYYFLTKADGSSFQNGSYIHVFAAFSCQSTKNNDFSNIYWSKLSYIGYFQF